MITANGYSKDQSIPPEGIVLTMPVKFFEDRQMTTDEFRKEFERVMSEEDNYWNFLLKNLPTADKIELLQYVYIVFDKKIQYRCNFVEVQRGKSKAFQDAPDGLIREFQKKNWVILAGPAERAPHDIPQRGFQGFRYCTKIF